MGGMLTQPVTKKQSDQGEGLGLKYGISSMQGWRTEMEDTHDIKLGLKYGLDDWSFFAVFDGHAGKRAAGFAACNLLDFILNDSQFELNADNPSDLSFIEPDLEKSDNGQKVEKISSQSLDNVSSSASKHETAPSDVVIESDTPEANFNKIGDRTGSLDVLETTQSNTDDATKTNATEDATASVDSKFSSYSIAEQKDLVKEAIRSAFLRVDQSMRTSSHDTSGCTAICTMISPTHIFIANCGDSRAVFYDGSSTSLVATDDHKPFHPKERERILKAGGEATSRIRGTLAVSRALGDFEFKKNELLGPCDQLVSPEPEVFIIERQPKDQFLILACDGIWDVMSNVDICEFVNWKLTVEPSLEKVCSSVIDVCLNKGSRDNMSIIIVVFENGPKFSEAAREREIVNDQKLAKIGRNVCDKLDAYYESQVEFKNFVYELKIMGTWHILPPGAGMEGKYDVLREVYYSCRPDDRPKSDE